MQELMKYINELLYLHDCVILPGFGGFVANYKSAQIDESTNSFMPPSKNISFNRNLSKNDGLLINKLVDKTNVPYVDAEKTVSFFIEDLNVKIHRGDKVYFDGLGVFYRDSQHNLQFEPNLKTNYLVDSYGLQSFTFSPISLVNKTIPKSDTSTRRITYKQVLLCAVVGVPLLFVSAYYFFSEEQKLNYTNHEVRASLDLVSDSNIASTNNHTKNNITNLKSPAEDLVCFTPVLVETSNELQKSIKGKYYLIAGSFSDFKNANILKSELEKKLYPAFIFKNRNLYSVAFDVFDSREEALVYKKTVINSNPKANTWIMKK